HLTGWSGFPSFNILAAGPGSLAWALAYHPAAVTPLRSKKKGSVVSFRITNGASQAMSQQLTRRRFLHAAAGAGLSGGLPIGVAWADTAEGAPDIIRFGPDLEPVVRLIEETPREKCVAALAEQLRGGLPYRRFLAAVFLAAICKRNPHHAVYLV